MFQCQEEEKSEAERKAAAEQKLKALESKLAQRGFQERSEVGAGEEKQGQEIKPYPYVQEDHSSQQVRNLQCPCHCFFGNRFSSLVFLGRPGQPYSVRSNNLQAGGGAERISDHQRTQVVVLSRDSANDAHGRESRQRIEPRSDAPRYAFQCFLPLPAPRCLH